ncbi:MAG: hypothetical protein NPIRA02_32490 [Nitrospirales bacterium]|nr:MAG: hypothetical protein NPIRA02_32490 [Nitrospirales bacterium]
MKVEDDLIRMHQHGVCEHSETQAGKYYEAFGDRFEQLNEYICTASPSMTF